jgi:hypothetical protein
MDEEIADAMFQPSFSPAVSRGVLELSCVARKRVNNFYVYRNIVVRRRYKFTDFVSDCPAAGTRPPEMHVSPIETYRNVARTRRPLASAPSLEENS